MKRVLCATLSEDYSDVLDTPTPDGQLLGDILLA